MKKFPLLIWIIIILANLILGYAANSKLPLRNSLLDQAHVAYKLDDEKVTDFQIEWVNMDILTKPNTRYIGEIMLSCPCGARIAF